MPTDAPQVDPIDLLTWLAFAETKDPEDALAIMHVVLNRMKRPKRFGGTLEDVIYKPAQFTGVGGKEWEKAKSGKLTEEEQAIATQFRELAQGAVMGILADPTGGADHYYNPELANPSWGNMPEQYPETYKTQFHRYLRENY